MLNHQTVPPDSTVLTTTQKRWRGGVVRHAVLCIDSRIGELTPLQRVTGRSNDCWHSDGNDGVYAVFDQSFVLSSGC